MSPSPLQELHDSLGARWIESHGVPTVGDYGDPSGEYAALGHAAGVVDLGSRTRLCLTGADRVRLLHGQVTNDIRGLPAGGGCQAALVTAKGRLQAILHVFALDDELLLETEPGFTGRLQERFDQYIIADDVQVVDIAPHYALFTVQGPRADAVLGRLDAGWPLPERTWSWTRRPDTGSGEMYAMRVPRGIGTPGIDLHVPTDAAAMVFDRLVAAARDEGGCICGEAALDQRRIEAGRPRFGVDLDETSLAPEGGDAFVAETIHYQKGCYIGQEVIARIRTYGQVTRALRGLVLTANPDPLPAPGARLWHGEREVGRLTSILRSPDLGVPIALGLVRKECHAIGTDLEVRDEHVTTPARIVPIPFTTP